MPASLLQEVSDGTASLCLGIPIEPEALGLAKESGVNFVRNYVLLTKERGGEKAGKGDLGQLNTFGS